MSRSSEYMSIDLVRGPAGVTTSCGGLCLGGAFATEPIAHDPEEGYPLRQGHTWADVSLVAHRSVTHRDLVGAARMLLAQAGLAIPLLGLPVADDVADREAKALLLAHARAAIWAR